MKIVTLELYKFKGVEQSVFNGPVKVGFPLNYLETTNIYLEEKAPIF